jgi:hypothetical protein
MAQHTAASSAPTRRSTTASGVAVITAALMVGMAPLPTGRAAVTPAAPSRTGCHRPFREVLPSE